jgi:hypothetical protein
MGCMKRDKTSSAKDRFHFIKAAIKELEVLNLKSVAIDPELKLINAEGGWIALDVFQGEKILKAVFSIIEISSTSVAEQSIILWPDDGYDLPVFWCNLTQMPGMSFHIFDLIPLMDLVVWPSYREKYLSLLPELKKKAIDHFKDGIAEKDFDLTSVVALAFSPYRICFKLTDEGVALIAPVVEEYCKIYVELWQKATPVKQPEESAFCTRKSEAVRKLMKENDPGYPIMTSIFGEEITSKVFDIVF